MNKLNFYKQALDRKLEQDRFRQLRFVDPSNSDGLLNFITSDPLSLAGHPHVKKSTIKYVLKWGSGSSGARVITEHINCHHEVEAKFAKLSGYQSCLLFNSGAQVHALLIPLLVDQKSLIFLDRGCHPALSKGAYASKATVIRYDHNDFTHLGELLKEHAECKVSTKLIISESVFFNEGDLSYVKPLSDLAKKHQALLYMDDTYGFGVMGENGMGLTSHKHGIDIVVGSFGKMLSTFGSYVLSSKLMKEYLLNFSPELSGSIPIPPAILGAIDAMLDLIPDMHAERAHLKQLSQYFRRSLFDQGFDIGRSASHIALLHFKAQEEALDLYNTLSKHKIQVTLLRPPATPANTAKVKFILTARHTKQDLFTLLEILSKWKRPLLVEALVDSK
ncbi:MAG: pyridoxal phosphate-dependent aminotransferase family protein [Simkaniaceae bacterium]|nr:pyridoxal phosphate-dependent aminotransferase family protein [Simkaniaceae bacterium]